MRYQLAVCESVNSTYFYGTLYIIQGLLLTFGAFLAYETRKVGVLYRLIHYIEINFNFITAYQEKYSIEVSLNLTLE